MYMNVLLAHIYVHCVCLVPVEVRRRCAIWTGVLEGTSAQAKLSALNLSHCCSTKLLKKGRFMAHAKKLCQDRRKSKKSESI